MLVVHAGGENRDFQDGSVLHLERKRRWPSFYLDKNHDFDLLFWRYYDKIRRALREFQPDVVHITGPSDLGIMGALLAHQLGVPLAASWHTNIHEYAELRAAKLLRALPAPWRAASGESIRKGSFAATARFYQIARLLFAPNCELVSLLEKSTGKPCALMGRGVDTTLFDPAKRDRSPGPFKLGFVGRLTVEKNVRLLVEVERALLALGRKNLRFLIVGQGVLEPWLRENLHRGTFAGVLKPVYLRVMRSPAPTLTWMCSLSPRARIPSATSFSRLWRPEYPRWSPTRVGQSSLSGTVRLALPYRMYASFPRRWSG